MKLAIIGSRNCPSIDIASHLNIPDTINAKNSRKYGKTIKLYNSLNH